MENFIMEKVNILYKNVNGLHFFTGGDDISAGLCVFDYDLDVAFEDIELLLKSLIKAKFGIMANIKPEKAISEMKAMLMDKYTKADVFVETPLVSNMVWNVPELVAA